MSKKWKVRIIAFIAVLGGASAAALLKPQEAVALQCCSSCYPNWMHCNSKCGSNQTCLFNCEAKYEGCINTCSESC